MSEPAPPTGDGSPIAPDAPPQPPWADSPVCPHQAELEQPAPSSEPPPPPEPIEPVAPDAPPEPPWADSPVCPHQAELEQPAPSSEPPPPPEPIEPDIGQAVIARYGALRAIGLFRHELEAPLRLGTKVVVRSERGLELAEVISNLSQQEGPGCISQARLEAFLRVAGPEYPFLRHGKVLRLANAQDLIDQRHLDSSASDEATYCRKEIREMNLAMKVVAVEHLLGGERIIFYFASEARVDFRELVRRLAGQFRTRIEMRQVGARDEAKLVGDLERCGRPCCCRTFLKYLQPISMRMAKTQKATLDPSKISGRCGRLMCCLRYEDAGYEELRGKLPRKNSYVRTADGKIGKVVDTQILTQLVRLAMADNAQVIVANEEIVERDVPPPPLPLVRPVAAPTAGLTQQVQAPVVRVDARTANGREQRPAPRLFESGQSARDTEGQPQRMEGQPRPPQTLAAPPRQPDRDAPRPADSAPTGGGAPQAQENPQGQGGQPAGEGGGRRKRRRRRRRR